MSLTPALTPPVIIISPSPPASVVPSQSPPPPVTSPSPPSSDSTPPAPATPPPPAASVSPPPAPSTPPVILSPPPPPLSPSPPPPIPTPPPPTPSPSPPPPTPSPSPPPLPPIPSPPPPTPSPSPPPPSPSPPPPTPSPSPSPPPPSPSPPPPTPPPPSPSPPPPSPSPPPPSPSPPSPPPSSSPSPVSAPAPPLSPPPPPVSPPPPHGSPPPPPTSPPLPQSTPPPSPTTSDISPPPRSNSIKYPPPPPRSQTHAPPSRSSSSPHISTGLVAGVVIGSVVVLAVFVLLWLLFAKRKRKQDPHGSEGYYLATGYYNGGPAQSGHHSNPASAEHFAVPKPSPPPVAVVPSISSSAALSSTPAQPLSMNGSGGFWSNGSGHDSSPPPPSPGIVLGNTTSSFSYEELAVATNGFSNHNLLGQGGFGYVHKGVLPNGKIVAVKSLKADSGQGDREFQAEVETISRVHHKHLVSLVGYCISSSQKLLVYEFVANKTLEFHLNGKGQPVMDWPTRMKIAVGAAKGLAYLHEDCHPRIIHRDIKAANILLDFNFEAKVADFGLAKFSSDANTHISTRVMGTFGYLAPEYASSGKLTEKSDIFSFGVVLLELITGRRPVDYTSSSEVEDSLVDWARPLFAKALRDGNFDSLVDPRLENNYKYEEMGCMITCAASCVRHSAKRRPRMSQVVRALEGNLSLSELNDGVKPGFSSFQGSSDIDNSQSEEDMQKFRKMVYESDDDPSSQFVGTTSKYAWSKTKTEMPNMKDNQ